MRILDCTLRDGGYYTNWDFDDALAETYFTSMEGLPVDILEIGYRSKSLGGYYGKYFYMPTYILEKARLLAPSKKIAIMLNEKDCRPQDLDALLDPCKGFVDVVRIAVSPTRLKEAKQLAEGIKNKGFQLGFNLMYMSTLVGNNEVFAKLAEFNGIADTFSLVDSYGGVFPNQVRECVELVKSIMPQTEIGFHGHNNIELAFINSLTALEAGCEIVDSTITGMGRGAGNLKTELFLTWLATNRGENIDFNLLSNVVGEFEEMQKQYGWGTNLPYMVSGANSLPQKDVMDWVTKRFYSINSIIQALHNQKSGQADNLRLPLFEETAPEGQTAIIVGGGKTVTGHIEALRSLVANKPEKYCLIHASSTNAKNFQDFQVPQYFCLVGNEGHRLERVFNDFTSFHGKCVLPPYPRKMGTYIPSALKNFSFELPAVQFTEQFTDSHTALALQTALSLGIKNIWVAGYDGYSGQILQKERDLLQENEYLFNAVTPHLDALWAITPTKYKALQEESIYAVLFDS